MISAATPPPRSRASLADAVVGSLATRDFAQLAELLEPDAELHALLPGGFHEWTGADRVVAAFVRWFGHVEDWELVASTCGVHGVRLQVGWRARVRGGRFGDATLVVEQHVYAETGPTGRIATMAMLCSGFAPEHADG